MDKLLTIGSCVLLLALSACSGSARHTRPYAKPELTQLLTELKARQGQAHSFMAESRMEYWVNDERVKPTVLVMGERGAQVRFNALLPDGSVAADLACNGADFRFVDYNNNCHLTGPCNKDSIGKLLRVSLEPDDFLLLAIGQAPLIADPSGTVRWDAKAGHEVLDLHSADGLWKQQIVLDGSEQRWDILSSTVWNTEGKVEWKLSNKEFSDQTSEDGKSMRVPSKTRFEQPQAKAELSIRWIERQINPELSSDKFDLEIPPIPRCGASQP